MGTLVCLSKVVSLTTTRSLFQISIQSVELICSVVRFCMDIISLLVGVVPTHHVLTSTTSLVHSAKQRYNKRVLAGVKSFLVLDERSVALDDGCIICIHTIQSLI